MQLLFLSLISFTITRNTEKEKIAYFINFYNMSLLYTTWGLNIKTSKYTYT